MSARFNRLITAALLGLVLCMKGDAQPLGHGSIVAHDHSSASKGGSTLAPSTLIIPTGATETVNGALIFSTFTDVTVNLAGLTFGGISGRASHFTNCMATAPFISDGISTYSVTMDLVAQIGSGSNTFGYFVVLDSSITASILGGEWQTPAKPLRACYLTSLEQRPCYMNVEIAPPSAGPHSVCLGFGQTNFGDTVTVGGSVWPGGSNFKVKIAR